MICISWGLPSSKQQSDCVARTRPGAFNVDEKYVGSTQKEPFTTDHKQELQKDGYFINNVRVQLGTGETTYLKAKESLRNWRHFQLGWSSVDPSTPVKVEQRFLVRVNELLLVWVLQPLEIMYVHDTHCNKTSGALLQKGPYPTISKENTKDCFAFGSGTLKGHLLAGEEMFAVEWKEDDSVWYEVLSFSKPAAFLSRAAYPYVQWRQRLFAKQSSAAMVKAVSDSTS
eukprot:c15577_g1_i1 orf=99-782(+)